MILKVILIASVIYGIKLVMKASKIVSSHEIEKKKKEKSEKDNVVDAEYTTLRD
jgi:hypothetical protein